MTTFSHSFKPLNALKVPFTKEGYEFYLCFQIHSLPANSNSPHPFYPLRTLKTKSTKKYYFANIKTKTRIFSLFNPFLIHLCAKHLSTNII